MLRQTGARRIKKSDVYAPALRGVALHEFARIGAHKSAVARLVEPCVFRRIAHGGGVQLRPDNMSGFIGGNYPDRSCAAIGIYYRFAPRKLRSGDRLAVEELRLDGVHLAEGARRYTEPLPADDILDIPSAVNDLFLFAQNERSPAVVHVEHDGFYIRICGGKRLRERLLRGEHRRCRHKHDHYFARGKAAPHQHMAQKPVPGALVVCRQPEIREHFPHGNDYFVGGFILQKAFVGGEYPVRGCLINTGYHTACAVEPERRLHLSAVIVRVFHADDRADTAKPADLFYHRRLLECKLLAVFEVRKLAAAAFARVRAVVFDHFAFFCDAA